MKQPPVRTPVRTPVLTLESLESRRLFADPWSDPLALIDLDDAVASYPTITGDGVTIALLDTGIDYNHPLLGGGFGPGFKVKAGYDFVDNDADPMDPLGHGTANAGLIGANPYDDNGRHAQGIAPGADLVALRVAGTGVVSFQQIERALDWIIENHETYDISIVNFSFGAGRYTAIENNATISDELKQIADLGILFVSPSGNQGGVGVMYPGADVSVITAGSVSITDQISTTTQRGPLLDFLAPGELLQTLSLGGGFTNVTDGSYPPPVLAGAAALLKQVDPKLKRNDLLSILSASSVTRTDAGINYPRIDIDNAILLAQRRQANPLSDVGSNGAANDLAYDKWGILHFTYYDQAHRRLKYATRSTSGEWSVTQNVDTTGFDVGATHSLAVDSLGRPSVAYYDATEGDLEFARFDGRTWKRSTLDTKNVVGQFPSLDFDINGNAVLAYYRKTSGDLRVMRWTGAAWVRDEPDTGGISGNVGLFASLDVSASGAVGVAYADATNGDLKYAQYNGSTWNVETVDNLDTVAFISLAFDRTNVPAISYYDALPANLKYATKGGGTWSNETIVSRGAVGLDTNLWFDDAGKANIIYFSRKSNALFRLNGSIANWTAETLTLLGGMRAVASATLDGSAASYAWFDTAQNKLVFGDVT